MASRQDANHVNLIFREDADRLHLEMAEDGREVFLRQDGKSRPARAG